MLMLEVPRRFAPERSITSYSYRLRRPVVVDSHIQAARIDTTVRSDTGDTSSDQWSVAILVDETIAATGEIRFAAATGSPGNREA